MAEPTYFLIEASAVIEVTGRHAARYLNNRLTNDIIGMQREPCAPDGVVVRRAGALNAQGRLEGFFTVIFTPQRPESFLLVSDVGRHSADCRNLLARYRVAESVEFLDRNDLFLVHSNDHTLRSLKGLGWERNRGLADGFDMLLPDISVPEILHPGFVASDVASQKGRVLSVIEQTRLRVLTGEPQFGVDFDSDSLLPEIGLPNTVSFTKGCYVGQEVVARIDALGKPPRVLVRCKIEGGDALDETAITLVAEKKRVIGEVSTAIEVDGNQRGFAMLRNDEQVLSSASLYVGPRKLTIV